MTNEDFTLLGILFFLAVVISIVCTKLIILNAARFGLISKPTARCAHVNPTPKGGGLAFVISFLTILGLLYLWNYITGTIVLSIGLGSFFIALIGFFDDCLHLSAKSRLIIQLLIITATLFVFSPLPQIELLGLK